MSERYEITRYYSMRERRYKWGVYVVKWASDSRWVDSRMIFSGTAKEARSKAKKLNAQRQEVTG